MCVDNVVATQQPLVPSTTTSALKTFVPTNYTIVPGFFVQDDPDFDATGFNLLNHSFGLKDEASPTRWFNFQHKISMLNQQADQHTIYKVLFVARHGQGYHNVAEAKYGTRPWNEYWSRIEGDGNITWGPDPLLTPLGLDQAKANNVAWKQQLQDGVPLPESLYSSPLSRSAKTLELTWQDVVIEPRRIRPLFKERLRETIGLHTCDRRSDKSVLAKRFPAFDFEPSFSEHIFATDSNTYISITAHGGMINALFRVVGHRHVPILPGGFIPMVVKATDDNKQSSELLAGGQSVKAGPLPTAPPHVEL
ncbi:putative phosphoglycerate mutase pmu1 [Microbotryomycetes sp. JL221]|nr:putative phosphoglycerate mutase pmu1 [Microbotryomycetes sp. JL221]